MTFNYNSDDRYLVLALVSLQVRCVTGLSLHRSQSQARDWHGQRRHQARCSATPRRGRESARSPSQGEETSCSGRMIRVDAREMWKCSILLIQYNLANFSTIFASKSVQILKFKRCFTCFCIWNWDHLKCVLKYEFFKHWGQKRWKHSEIRNVGLNSYNVKKLEKFFIPPW